MKKAKVFQNIFVTYILICLGAAYFLGDKIHKKLTIESGGKALNENAWVSSYIERDMPVPAEPREGYWGTKLRGKMSWNKELNGFFVKDLYLKDFVEIDNFGAQTIGANEYDIHLMILGGSVAWGAYASTLELTYFKVLYNKLKKKNIRVKITNHAVGSLTSEGELKLLKANLKRVSPNFVLMLNGLNDLTATTDPKEDVNTKYIERMKEVKEIVREQNIKVIFAPQPFSPFKNIKSKWEKRILELPIKHWEKQTEINWLDIYKKQYPDLIKRLKSIVNEGHTSFLNLSDIYDQEDKTIFSDFWHFSDIGHRILGEKLSYSLFPLFKANLSKQSHR